MTKKIIISALAIALVLSCLLVAGCESFKFNALSEVPNVNSYVESNGGLAVKQGDYVYFINGQTDYAYTESSQNYFNHKNNANKGALVRAKLDANGQITGDPVIVVPKNIMTSYTKGGFYIYGQWIYYTSPTTKASSNSTIKSELIFYRTKIDGTGTQEITTVASQSFEYIVTPVSIIYYLNNELYHIDTTVKKNFKINKVAEGISTVIFPKNDKYNPTSVNYLASTIFFTKSSEDEFARVNETFALDCYGSTHKIFDQKSFTQEPEKLENIEKVFNITLKNAVQTDAGIALYYEKGYYRGGSVTSVGLFSIEFKDTNKLDAINLSNEKHLFQTTLTPSYIINADSFYYIDSNKLYKHTYDATKQIGASTEIQDFENAITYEYLIKIGDITYFYYSLSSIIYRFPIEGTQDKYAQSIVSSSNMSTAWLTKEYIGTLLFYTNSSDNNYTFVVDLKTYNPRAVGEEEVISNVKAGIKTAADQALEDEED